MSTFAIAAFYRFLPLSDLPSLREQLHGICVAQGIKGTLLLAPEGLNGTLAGFPEELAAALDGIREAVGCPDLRPRMSIHDAQPFGRLKVRIKREIVTLGVPGTDPTRRTGTPVPPHAWNDLLSDPDIPVLDVRNGFEHALGTFTGAIDPGTAAFGNFPAYVRRTLDPARHKAVAMFCTGGIRCEKASAFMLDQGFETVYQLEGGILAYLDEVPERESLWQGGCFVFDERGAVGAGLRPMPVRLCPTCSAPLPSSAEGSNVRCAACNETVLAGA